MIRQNFLKILMLASALLVSPAYADGQKSDPSADGLEPIKLKGIDHALVRPGVQLADYTRIRLDPIDVSFDKNWNPTRTGSHLYLRPQDREKIRTGMADVVREAFEQALTTPRNGRPGYTLTDDDGSDVLRVRVAIVDLYVTAPDTNEPGLIRVYTVSTGEATLRAELVDSVSGTVLARLTDTRESRSPSGRLELTDRIRNRSDAEGVASAWGRILRKYLDAANAGNQTTSGVGRQ